MAKDPAEFTQQNTQRAMQAATFGMNWFREVAEQNLNQSAIALDALLTVARKSAQEVESQTSVIYDHSIALTEETITNTLDLGHKLVRLREPQEIAQFQSEFLSRQTQAVADRTKQLGQACLKGAEELGSRTFATTADSVGTQSKAA